MNTVNLLTAVVAIVIEALFDCLLDTPVYVIDGAYQTIKGREPSVCKYLQVGKEDIVNPGVPGIDRKELKLIRSLSGLAGDRSKILSGAVYRLFGGAEISFVIGGNFSFGDNETLAKILDTLFEVAAKRISEEIAYQGFLSVTVSGYPKKSTIGLSEAERLLFAMP